MTWEYFQQRWDMMQSVEIGRNTVDIGKLREDLISTQRTLVYLLGRMMLDQKVTLDDPVVKAFLHLRGEDPRAAVTELVGRIRDLAAPRVINCPKCGAGVRDLEGVHDEVCQWCGHELRTAF